MTATACLTNAIGLRFVTSGLSANWTASRLWTPQRRQQSNLTRQPDKLPGVAKLVSDSIVVTVGIPHRVLSPNARCHWAIKMKATRRARVESWAAVQIAMHERGIHAGKWPEVDCQVIWYAKTERRRDRDNCLASLKPTFDGLVDGGLLDDDSGITHLPMIIDTDRKNPRVELHIKRKDS
jgi:Holliday junction resolvase RusA-like endonuclease